MDDVIRHAYCHVPFCPQICPFCSFHVLRREPGAVAAYLRRLDDEAATLADRFDVRLDTTYLGGGTPSHLRVDELHVLLGSMRQRFGGLGSEVTLEIHPATATADRAARWHDLGITRFSVGVESTDDEVLRRLGRRHSAADAVAAVEACRAVAGRGDVVSADLMTAIEGQDVVAELRRLVDLGVDHVSCYTLTIEEGTPFERDGVVVDPDVAADAYEAAGSVLAAAGILRYEVSNHARPGAECRHNLAYWRSDWWIGLGPSAAAHLPSLGVRFHTSVAEPPQIGVREVNRHVGEWLEGRAPAVEPLDAVAWVEHAVVAGLRTVDGVALDVLSARAGLDVAGRYARRIDELVADGLLRREATRLAATPRGLATLDAVTSRLLC